MAEEIFENRRNLEIMRPKIKEQVLTKLRSCLAGPAFLVGLKQGTKEIDDYLHKYERVKEHGDNYGKRISSLQPTT